MKKIKSEIIENCFIKSELLLKNNQFKNIIIIKKILKLNLNKNKKNNKNKKDYKNCEIFKELNWDKKEI